MAHTTTIADLRNAGVAIEPHEAVALVLELIQNPTCDPPEPPFGPPSPANIHLDADGSVACRACETTPAVSEVAILLQRLLGDAPHGAPGGLRYAIARALLDVDAPPFDSLTEFAAVLTRFERGDRERILRALFARLAEAQRAVPATVTTFQTTIDRRQLMPSATDLRRELRKVDEQLYAHKRANDAAMARHAAEQAAIPAVIVEPRQPRRMNAVAAGLAIGLVLAGSGELMHLRQHSAHAERAATMATQETATALPAAPVVAERRLDADDETNASAVVEPRRVPTTDADQTVATGSRAPVSRVSRDNRADQRSSSGTSRRRIAVRRATHRHAEDGGVLKRLRLQWLKSVFSSRS